MKQDPFNSNKYFLRFDRKCVLHNQDEKLVWCSLKNWEKFVKTGFTQESLSKRHLANFYKFYSLWKICWKAKSSLESEILEFSFQSSHFSQNRSNFHSNTSSLDLQSSIAQMNIQGSKMGVYIDIIGEVKLKGHQINGSLPLGNIIVHLSLPQLIPHYDNLHWRMDNFGLPYRIELGFGT